MLRGGALLALFLVALLGGVGLWINTPQLEHPQVANQILIDSTQRFQERQKRAQSPQLNGFLAPQFRPFWEGRGRVKPGSSFEKAVRGWEEYSCVTYQEPTDHRTLLNRKDLIYLEKRATFAEYLSALKDALGKPYFIDPAAGACEIPNLIALRSIAISAAALAESQWAEGGEQQAVTSVVVALDTGRQLFEDSSLSQMVGIGCHLAVVEMLYRAWSSETEHSWEEWRELADHLSTACLTKAQIIRSHEQDLFRGFITVQSVIKNPSSLGTLASLGLANSPNFAYILHAPGMLEREKRIFLNQATRIIVALQQPLEAVLKTQTTSFSWGSWLLGKSSLLVSGPEDQARAVALVLDYQAQMAGLATVAGLKAYHGKSGAYPQDLTQLSELGLQSIEGFEWEKMEYTPGESLLVKIPSEAVTLLRKTTRTPGWVTRSPDGLQFRLSFTEKEAMEGDEG